MSDLLERVPFRKTVLIPIFDEDDVDPHAVPAPFGIAEQDELPRGFRQPAFFVFALEVSGGVSRVPEDVHVRRLVRHHRVLVEPDGPARLPSGWRRLLGRWAGGSGGGLVAPRLPPLPFLLSPETEARPTNRCSVPPP